eukprot:1126315-Pelagomonas_calceolata.AAC.3
MATAADSGLSSELAGKLALAHAPPAAAPVSLGRRVCGHPAAGIGRCATGRQGHRGHGAGAPGVLFTQYLHINTRELELWECCGCPIGCSSKDISTCVHIYTASMSTACRRTTIACRNVLCTTHCALRGHLECMMPSMWGTYWSFEKKSEVSDMRCSGHWA